MPNLAFAICVESGGLERQAVLLCESIRRFGGRVSAAPIYAVSPRSRHRPSTLTQARLGALDVDYVEESLNVDYVRFPMIANKPLMAAHVETSTDHELIVVMDTDTLVLAEPAELLLDASEDVAARPADTAGVATRDLPGDRFDPYWRELCAAVGVSYDSLPVLRTFVDQVEVRAVHQTGCLSVRRERGILRAWGRYLSHSLERGLGPPLDDRERRNSVETLTGEQARWWGADIPTLSLAIWGTTQRLRLLSSAYNYPLHLHPRVPRRLRAADVRGLAHVHYHWLLEPDHHHHNPLFDPAFGLPGETRRWLRDAAATRRR